MVCHEHGMGGQSGDLNENGTHRFISLNIQIGYQ